MGSVMSQARRRGSDRGRRRSARGSHAGAVIERALIILLVMMIRHVHRSGGVRTGVHTVVMMMVTGRRRVRVRMMRRAKVGVTLMQLVHLHFGRLGVLGTRRRASGVAR